MKMQNGSPSPDRTDCYVAFLDILGFKGIALAHTHEHLKSVYQRFREAIEHGLSNGRYVLLDSGGTKCIGPDIRRATVNSLLVSDCILIWTDDNSAESFVNIVVAVRSLLAFSMVNRIPLRGAISIGPITSLVNHWPSQTHNFEHSLFGKAIVDAVEAERQQKWCGCMITKAAVEHYKNNCPAKESLIEKKIIVSYPVPQKDGETLGYVIDWVNHPQTKINAQTVEKAFAPPINPDSNEWKKDQIEWKKNVEIKLRNTLKFLEHVCEQKS